MKVTRKHKLWWNTSLTNLRKQVRLARNAWKSDKNDSILKDAYLKVQKIFDCEVSRAKRNFIKKKHEDLAFSLRKDPRQFWRMIGKLGNVSSRTRKRIPKRVLNSEGDTVTGDNEVLEVWGSYFESLLNSNSTKEAALPCPSSPNDLTPVS